MDPLEELLDRLTIKFPEPIEFGEIERKLFEYLKSEAQCSIAYDLNIRGDIRPDSKSERYASKIDGTVSRFRNKGIASFPFTITRDRNEDFVEIKIMHVPGYDSIEEFESMPSGKGQLILVDEIREKVNKYFSQRSKRSK